MVRGGRLGEIHPQEGKGGVMALGTCEIQTIVLLIPFLFAVHSLFSTEALKPKGLEPSFSETARRRWLRWSPTFFFFFFLFGTTPAAYGSSQARGLISAIAAGLHTITAMWDPSRICELHHSSQQRQVMY